MKQFVPFLILPLIAIAGCTQGDSSAQAASLSQQPTTSGEFAALSDEFDNPATVSQWRHAYKDEGRNANQLERFDIAKTRPGWMMMQPYTSSWYQDYCGILAYKPVTGDFVMTTHLRVSSRNGGGPPQAQYSLAGIMIRNPRNDTAQTWRPGAENYVFLSVGAADHPGSYQFEVKTTTNSNSQLRIAPAPSGDVLLQVARIGNNLLLLKKAGGQWSVHQRYWRPDLSAKVQAGLTCYTDWQSVSGLSPQQHNATVIRNGNPDLLVFYDFVRYRRPQIPAGLTGKRLADPQAVSDAELLSFLGEAAAK